MASPIPEQTVRAARTAALARLRETSPSAALDADLLLCATLGIGRAALLADLDRAFPPDAAARFAQWLERAADGEPIAYLLGTRAFHTLDLAVSPAVLVPRPETEHLLEAALAWAHLHPQPVGEDGFYAADIGTGSGALAVAFAHASTRAFAHPAVRIAAVDVSADALAVARLNAERTGAGGQIVFYTGDLLEPLIGRGLRVRVLMANLPYIPSAEVDRLPVARHEPRQALDGGPDGLLLIRRLLADAPRVLAPPAGVFLEIGADQGEAAARLTAEALPGAHVAVLRDYAGHDRVIAAAWEGV
jgi:release factor glutamine methyltransferase